MFNEPAPPTSRPPPPSHTDVSSVQSNLKVKDTSSVGVLGYVFFF